MWRRMHRLLGLEFDEGRSAAVESGSAARRVSSNPEPALGAVPADKRNFFPDTGRNFCRQKPIGDHSGHTGYLGVIYGRAMISHRAQVMTMPIVFPGDLVFLERDTKTAEYVIDDSLNWPSLVHHRDNSRCQVRVRP
jgi:hypothetical protein